MCYIVIDSMLRFTVRVPFWYKLVQNLFKKINEHKYHKVGL